MEINLTEIVRKEVKAILKEMLTKQLIIKETNVIKSGDYETEDDKPLDDRIQVNVPDYQLPVKVIKSDGTVQHRRSKRTQAEMREAIHNALPQVASKHPSWSERRQRRLAKNLVRRYKL